MPRIEVDEFRCKGCGLCTTACPAHLITLGDRLNLQGYRVVHMTSPEKCTGCALCGRLCPDMAIIVYK